jgi:5-methyltetrahydrofolate--homocysteine methyltransferase
VYVYIDPLVMPVSTDISQGAVTLETMRRLKEQYPAARSVLAVSNVSFGLPKRGLVNSAFISMAACLGADAVIINPLYRSLRGSVLASEALVGRDRHCRKYTRAARKESI